MPASPVSVERKGRVAVIRFDRGDGKNALSRQVSAAPRPRKRSRSRAGHRTAPRLRHSDSETTGL